MTILTSSLPSGGYGYDFPSIDIKPLTFLELTQYLENVPSDPLEKYLFDIKVLCKDDPKINDCYMMDVDFLIFFKKLISVSGDLNYNIQVKCPNCGNIINHTISMEHDIHFKQIDSQVMNGAKIELNGHLYETMIPTVRDFLRVFSIYLRYRKITDMKIIKTVALISGFDQRSQEVEDDVLGATHSDITLLLALYELYYDRVEPIELSCNKCEEGGNVTVSVESLIVDFFRDLCINSPIDGSKILFK